MKTKIMICILVIMFSAFAGSVWGGSENASILNMALKQATTTPVTKYFYWEYAAGCTTPPVKSYNTFIGYLAGFR